MRYCTDGHLGILGGLLLPPQALFSMPAGLCELLRSLHVHSLKNDEVLLLKDSRRLAEHKDAGPQVGGRSFVSAMECASRHVK